MNSKTSPLEGILLIDKPTGCTSHDVVDRVRRKLKMKRIGHAGTLDPLATGLLIILVGKATKASQYLTSLGKEYVATMKLGETTDSQDSDGIVTETKPVAQDIDEAKLQAVMEEFLGDQYQLPPMYSAKKIDGVPLYKLARKGKEVERPPRFIHVSDLRVQDIAMPEVTFYVLCSKGTYVRTLAHDMGQKLDCGAHLTALRRTATDKFNVADAYTLEDFENAAISDIRKRLINVYEAVPRFH